MVMEAVATTEKKAVLMMEWWCRCLGGVGVPRRGSREGEVSIKDLYLL